VAIELIPDLAGSCIELSTFGEVCVRFPGGAKLCASINVSELGDPGEIAKDLLGKVNSALMPLQPFFDMLDALKAIKDCITAIPDTLGPPPDPTALLACIPNLAKAIDKLLALIPPIPILNMVKDILNVIIIALTGIRVKLAAMIKQVARITAAALKATELGAFQLQVVVDCANGNMEAQLQNMNAGMAPLNRLIGVLNVLLEMAGRDCIPALGGFAEVSDAVLAPLDATIALLEALRALIPSLDLILPPVPPPGECA
jgi:hypothetical protein